MPAFKMLRVLLIVPLLISFTSAQLNSEGCYDTGDAVTGCDTKCASLGLICSEAQLEAHDSEVDSSSEVLALLRDLKT